MMWYHTYLAPSFHSNDTRHHFSNFQSPKYFHTRQIILIVTRKIVFMKQQCIIYIQLVSFHYAFFTLQSLIVYTCVSI